MGNMIEWQVKDVRYVEDYVLILRFADGRVKRIDFKDHLDGEVFKPLHDVEYFKTVHIVGSAIAWECGADFAPEFLYHDIGVDVVERTGTD